MQKSNGGHKHRGGRTGGAGSSDAAGNRNGYRRRRQNNQSNQQQQGTAYAPPREYIQDEGEFQAKLPTDTAPAYRVVEKRRHRGRGNNRGGQAQQDQQGNQVNQVNQGHQVPQNHQEQSFQREQNYQGQQEQRGSQGHQGQQSRQGQQNSHGQQKIQGQQGQQRQLQHRGQQRGLERTLSTGFERNQQVAWERGPRPFPNPQQRQWPSSIPASRSQNGSNPTIRPLRILSRPQQPQISGEPTVANSLIDQSNSACHPSKEETTSSPNLLESVSVAKPQAPQTPVTGQQNQHDNQTEKKDTVAAPSQALIPYAPPLAPPVFILKKQAVVEEPILRLSIRELLDTSDILETRDLPKLPRLPVAPPAPMMQAEPNDDSAFMSPLTIVGIPINPRGQTKNYEPTPVERFLKISDLTTRFLTERLTDIAYDPELSLRLQADFEVFEAAYHALPFERALNPYKVIFASVTALKKSVELRNNDAKIIGGLKEMTMAYDQIRSEALHGRWLRGEQPFPGKAAVAKLGQCGVDLVDSVGWNLQGGDQHCKLPPKVTRAVAPAPVGRTTGKFAKFFATPGVLGGLRKEMGM